MSDGLSLEHTAVWSAAEQLRATTPRTGPEATIAVRRGATRAGAPAVPVGRAAPGRAGGPRRRAPAGGESPPARGSGQPAHPATGGAVRAADAAAVGVADAAAVGAADAAAVGAPGPGARESGATGAAPSLDRAAPAPPSLPAPPARGGRKATSPRHRVSVRQRKPGKPALFQPTGPHVRLGILWAAVTLGAVLLGPVWLDGWLALVAALAAGSAARSWGTAAMAQRLGNNRRARVQPPAAVAAVFAALITVAALGGGLVVAVAAAAVAVILVAAATFGPLGQPGVMRRVVFVLGPGVGAACLVLARAHGLADGLVLAGMVTVFDSSNYLIGTGAPNHWEGSVAGAASIAALTLFVSAVLVPPFTGASPWLLGGSAALLAPLGPVLSRLATGDPEAKVPALRRLDSLFLVGPAWAAGVALLLHR